MTLTPYQLGWNAWLDSKSSDDNPWVECSDSGHEWMRGYIRADAASEEIGTDQMERFNEQA